MNTVDLHGEIKKDGQIWKFCFYGFFKNLKFFEPYLLIYLLGMGLSLFQIGLLYGVREGITYVFEVPSGIIADHYGKKKELLMCFGFYIVSFVFFFLGSNFVVIGVGMVFFGLGEAFRSGTHKAMILAYLEHRGWFEHKGFVYGRTRSFSLMGSALSAFASIIMVLNLPSLRWVFLICILPYVVDFLLIVSYPGFLDEKKETEKNLKTFFLVGISELKLVFKNPTLVKILLSSATYDGVFKTIKDYIQPILSHLLVVAGIGTVMSLSGDESMKVYLGVLYGVFYIFSSMVSRQAHRVTLRLGSEEVFSGIFDATGLLMILMAVVTRYELIVGVVVIYWGLYMLKDGRRTVFLDVCSDYMDKKQRATVLSVESQIRALLMMILAPVCGLIADVFSIGALFVVIGVMLIVVNRYYSSVKRN